MGWLKRLLGLELPDPEPLRALVCSACGQAFDVGVDAGLITDEQVADTLSDVGMAAPVSKGPAQPELVQHVTLDTDLLNQTEDALLIVAGSLSRGEKRLWTCGECKTVNAYPGYEQHLEGEPPPEQTHTIVAPDVTDPEKQFELGVRLMAGDDDPQDAATANQWFRKAADQGHAQAQFQLATNYHGGVGTDRDRSEAFKWYLRAAEQGIARAQCTVAIFINDGEVVPRDIDEVIRWLKLASDQGDGSACFNLGVMYYNGDGVPQSEREAIRLLRKSAAAGYEKAAEILRQLG